MNEWAKRFWNEHGDRIVFLSLAFSISLFLWWLLKELRGQLEGVMIAIPFFCLNKARGVKSETPLDLPAPTTGGGNLRHGEDGPQW
jgi:hypothetical protein